MNNFERLVMRYSRFVNIETSEDCLARVVISALKLNEDIQDPDAWVNTAIRGQFSNYRTVNRRYTYDHSAMEVTPAENVDYDNSMEKILSILPDLTKGQQSAIINFLEYGCHTKCPGNVQTQKSQYRNAVIQIKDKLCL
jgi:hypothetical protein